MAPQKNDNSKNQGQSPDPYLRAFLRQAVAIIAAERGFNDSCTAKIRVVAEQLGLAEDTIQEALEKLKMPQNNMGLNRYESEYFKILKRQFEKVRGKVITIESERKLVDLAESRYQIEAVRAHQIIQKVADQCEVGTISHADAKQFAQQLIVDTVGEQTELLDKDQQRLIRTCNKWGMEKSTTENTLHSIFARNRWKLKKRYLIFAFASIAGTIFILSVGIFVSKSDWSFLASSSDYPVSTNHNSKSDVSNYPDWWTDNIKSLASNVRGDYQMWIAQVAQVEPQKQDHEKVYLTIINQYLGQVSTNSNVEKWIAQIYCHEPTSASATKILNRIRDNIQHDGDIPLTVSQIRKSGKAIRIFGEMLFSAKAQRKLPDRFSNIASLNETLFGVSLDLESPTHFIDEALGKLNIDQWSQAVRFSLDDPEAVAIQLDELENRSASDNKEVNELRILVVQNLLRVMPRTWQAIKQSTSIAINESSDAILNSWLQLSRQTQNTSLKEFLSIKLAARSEGIELDSSLPSKSPDVGESMSAHSQRLQKIVQELLITKLATESKLKPHLGDDHFLQQDELPIATLVELLPVIVQSNNLIIGAISAIEYKVDFEQIELLKKFEVLPSPASDFNPITATPSESRRLTEAFERLFDAEPHQQNVRITAMKEIESLARKFTDIDYQIAKSLAHYVLENVATQETLAIERLLPSLANWPNLLLGIADHIEEYGVDSRTKDYLSLIKIQLPESEDVQNIELTAQNLLFQRSSAILNAQNKPAEEAWTNYYSSLKEFYSIRLGLLSGVGRNKTQNLGRSTYEWITHSFPNNTLWQRKSALIAKSQNGNEKLVARVALWNQIFAKLLKLPLPPPQQKSDEKLMIIEEFVDHELQLFDTLKKHIANLELEFD